MAFASFPARQGQQGSFRRILHDLGDDIQVHPVPLVLSGAGRPVRGDPVDRDERPVKDHVGVTCLLRVPDRLAELRGAGREQLHGLVHVPPCRGPADPEPCRDLGECVALLQVGEHEQGCLPGVQLPPP
jgi:hypothetical protein